MTQSSRLFHNEKRVIWHCQITLFYVWSCRKHEKTLGFALDHSLLLMLSSLEWELRLRGFCQDVFRLFPEILRLCHSLPRVVALPIVVKMDKGWSNIRRKLGLNTDDDLRETLTKTAQCLTCFLDSVWHYVIPSTIPPTVGTCFVI